MEISNVVDSKTEEILKEANSIYGFEKSKSVLYNYANYIDMRKSKEVRFGNYNVFIRDNSVYDSSEQLLNLIIKLLKEKQVVKGKCKYLEEDEIVSRRRKDDNKKIEYKEDILIINTKKSDISIRYIKKDLREMMKKFSEKVFIIIHDEDEMRGSTNVDLGDLIAWTMEIEKMSSENKIDYIKKYFKKNKFTLAKDNTFVETLAEEPFWKIKNEIINILTECKMRNISKITDNVIEKDLKLNYVDKKAIKCKYAIKELDKLIGIDEVKQQVYKILNYIDVNKQRENKPMLHMCFEGNPGTGKTTVARIIGEIFKQKDILSKNGKFVEVQRSDLVGKYVGWTAKQTQEAVKKAEGGVLFIDEAYNISPKGSEIDYGHECIATLIKEMEDKRDNLCVILAGYTNEMEEMLKVNPGFESRIQFKIKFPDYTEEELYEIFKQNCKKEKYRISSNVKEILLDYFAEEKQKENFSNGRCVRNLFEKIKFEQADRITKNANEDINMITKADVENVLIKCERVKAKAPLGFAC